MRGGPRPGAAMAKVDPSRVLGPAAERWYANRGSDSVLRVDQWLREEPPASDLVGAVRCVWRGDLGAMQIPLPDECFDLVCVNDGSVWLSGPETTSWPRHYSRGSHAVGIRFAPAVGPAVFRLDAWKLRDMRVRLDDLWPSRAAREVAERLDAAPNDAARLHELERVARVLAPQAGKIDRVALAIAAAVCSLRPATVTAAARSVGLSERQVLRRCRAAFGYGPAALARIRRAQRALALARTSPRPTLVKLAIAAGYSDQQHLAHEIRAIFGTTATELLARASDSYKTPRLRRCTFEA